MSEDKELDEWSEKTAHLYGLTQRLGVDPALWYSRDALTFKQRQNNFSSFKWRERSSGVGAWRDKVNTFSRYESVWSYDNPFWPYAVRKLVKQMDKQDPFVKWAVSFANTRGIGGSFLQMTDAWYATPCVVNDNLYQGQFTIAGVWGSSSVKPPDPNKTATAVSVLNSLGATAISRVLPNNPDANLSQFLGEMRERLPSPMLLSIYKDRTHNLVRNAGGEYLNYQFGWKPLVSDMVGFAKQIKRAEGTLEQYLKDSGKKVRRTYQFPDQKTVTVYNGVRYVTNSTNTGYAFIDGTSEVTEITKRWFSGAFRYHVPGGDSALDAMRKYSAYADRLLGVDLTPELLYNLTPWTWMLDWWTNIGDVMTNISNLGHDGMVMQYGYIMEHRTFRVVHTAYFQGKRVQTTQFFETKRRHPASPFGFGLTEGSLSKTQWAILAALGMSKSPGKL